MTNEEALTLIKSCKNRDELMKKLGGTKLDKVNAQQYFTPLKKQLKLNINEISALFNNTANAQKKEIPAK